MTINYICVFGKVKLVLFDDRVGSSTKGNLMEIYMSTENYNLVTVPPKVWNGFKTLGNENSIIANCSDIPHNPNEMIRKKYDDSYFNYNWNVKLS
jgi:dTDP-4-dehydrorhamnose 3,5-epimerase